MSDLRKPNHWLHAYEPVTTDGAEGECKCTKQRETRTWNRTVFVPEQMQPIDVITTYSFHLPLPPFFPMQPSVNKFDVECIASAMANPKLHWYTLYHLTIAPFEPFSAHGLQPAKIGEDFDPQEFIGANVLISGHHRFLAFLLSGTPPADKSHIQVIKAPTASSLFPWTVVEWGR